MTLNEYQWFIEDIIRYGGIGGKIVGCEPFYKIGEKFIKSDNIHRITDYINDCKKIIVIVILAERHLKKYMKIFKIINYSIWKIKKIQFI